MESVIGRIVIAWLVKCCYEAAICASGAGGHDGFHSDNFLAFRLERPRGSHQCSGRPKKDKTEKAIQPVEKKAAQASDEGRIIYRTITRDVVKYVQDPNRTVCKFDDESVRLRQRAIDAANSISGFDAGAVQGK